MGEFLDTARAEADLLPATFEIYAKKFRRLVAGVMRIDGGRTKHDHHGTGYKDWLARINAVKLSRLTSEAIQRWKTRHITAAGTNPLKERRARRTVASVLRCSKALFADRIVRKLHMDLPDPLPLAGVDIPRATPAQYDGSPRAWNASGCIGPKCSRLSASRYSLDCAATKSTR